TTWEYDPGTNNWTTKASMPVGHTFAGFGMINDHLYVVGGEGGYTSLLDYDVAANAWTGRAAMPAGAYEMGSAVVGGRQWVFGGIDSSTFQPTDATWIYDPVSNGWVAGPDLTIAHYDIGGAGAGPYAVAIRGITEVAHPACG